MTGPLGGPADIRPTGRIRTVQLNYTEAHGLLQQAIRRAPPPITAPGFYQTAHKFFVVVELLMGEIPDRQTFRHPVLEKALQPYSEIVQGTLLPCISLDGTDKSYFMPQLCVQAPSPSSKRPLPCTPRNSPQTRLSRSSRASDKT